MMSTTALSDVVVQWVELLSGSVDHYDHVIHSDRLELAEVVENEERGASSVTERTAETLLSK